jgi:hypothetical protein
MSVWLSPRRKKISTSLPFFDSFLAERSLFHNERGLSVTNVRMLLIPVRTVNLQYVQGDIYAPKRLQLHVDITPIRHLSQAIGCELGFDALVSDKRFQKFTRILG